jgi:methyl-accepting chemotaxis protein
MKNLQMKSIQIKITLWAGLCLLALSLILTGYAVWRLRIQAMAAAQEEATALAETNAASVKAEIEVALDLARTMAQALTAVKTEGAALTRDEVNAMLKELTTQNPDLIGTWTLWEPDAFDGQDAQYAGQAPYDQTGRFNVYWNRNEQGNIQVETPIEYETEDYYQLPKQTKQEVVTEPYLYPVQGKDVLMTSIVAPIMVNGQFYGVAGVDMGLEILQQLTDEMNAYEGMAEMALISNQGTLAGVTGHPELVGQLLEKYHENRQEHITYIQEGQTIYQEEEGRIEVFVPIQFGQTTTPWSVNLNIPTSQIVAEANAAMWQMTGIGAALALGTLVLLWLASGQVARPIRRIADVARVIAEGDLSRQVDVSGADEVGQLADVFRRMIAYLQEMADAAGRLAQGDLTVEVTPRSTRDALGNAFARMVADLRSLVGQVADSATNVGASAGQLSASADQSAQAVQQVAATVQQIAQGTAQQTESVTGAAATVEQVARAIGSVARGAQEQASAINQSAEITMRIAAAVQQVAVNAQSGAQGSAEAAQAARAGAGTVEKTIKGIERIRTSTATVAQKVQDMGRRSEQIGAIVETIDDIASQTNLLALNAAIEAARAGEHGKGFAVVADEVRKLAENSAKATKEIAGLIKDVQRTIAEAVRAMDEGAAEVDAGVTQADESGQALESIMVAVEAVNRQVNEIATAAQQMDVSANELVSAMDAVSAVVEENTAATEEMGASASEATTAIENIASVAEENSAATEEVSATVEEVSAQVEEVTASAQSLSAMAQELQALVTQFKLPGTGTQLAQTPWPTMAHEAVPPVIAASLDGDGREQQEPLLSARGW